MSSGEGENREIDTAFPDQWTIRLLDIGWGSYSLAISSQFSHQLLAVWPNNGRCQCAVRAHPLGPKKSNSGLPSFT